MESRRIEDKLKAYRERKEKERLAGIRASKPLYVRILPNVLIVPISKIVEASSRNRASSNNDVHSNERPEEAKEPSEAASDTVSSDNNIAEESVKPVLLKRKAKRSAVQSQVTSTPLVEDLSLYTDEHSNELAANYSQFWIVLLVLKLILWAVLFLLAIEFEWGAVFVVLSAFYVIFTNLRSDRRKPWEPSAYSVFNPGCQAIDGTLKAEQFEKEIRYGF